MGDSYIIAIDFGTAFSGYTFNITKTMGPSEPTLKRWGKELGLDTPKTPTCILFNEKEEFVSFGYKAKMAYINMKGEEAKRHFFFENFKMALYGKDINRKMTIKAANGKSMQALKVFTEALKFLKDDALKTTSSNASGFNFLACDFSWVLTVPSIWDQSAKQFMREAATQAGIVSEESEDKLLIALESEAASLWCKTLPADGFITQVHTRKTLDQTLGTKYIVVDCGGGTIDITVHEVLEGGVLKELHKASGNGLGGQTVDRNFKKFFRKIFCDGVWEEFEQEHPGGAQRMMYEFTRLKQVDEDVQITCPFNLLSLAEKRESVGTFFKSVQGGSWDGEFIQISRDQLRSFFDESLQGITLRLTEILRKLKQIDYILLVGGFAQSTILHQHITEHFADQCKVLCPFRAQEAILRGAVEFGRNPNWVVSRKSPFTYGIAVCEPFQESKHKAEKKVQRDGQELCWDIFLHLVTEGEDVGWNETREHILNPVEKDQTWMQMRFYRTERKFHKYVDDTGVDEVGSFKIDMPNVEGGIKREVKLEIMFGSTEITATATDLASGSKGSIKFDFIIEVEPSFINQTWDYYYYIEKETVAD